MKFVIISIIFGVLLYFCIAYIGHNYIMPNFAGFYEVRIGDNDPIQTKFVPRIKHELLQIKKLDGTYIMIPHNNDPISCVWVYTKEFK